MEDEDSWLYGNNESKQEAASTLPVQGTDKKATQENAETITVNGGDGNHSTENPTTTSNTNAQSTTDPKSPDVIIIEDKSTAVGVGRKNGEENNESDEDSDDDVQVTIGEITTNTASGEGGPMGHRTFYRSPGQAAGTPKTAGTSINKTLDISTPGSVNGLPVLDISLETLEDKPWRKPGADISDYFNYGFNEITWSLYCEKQRRLRSGMDAPIIQNTPVASAERASSVVSSILAKYDMRHRLAPSIAPAPAPVATRSNTTLVRSISTLFTQRGENGTIAAATRTETVSTAAAAPAASTAVAPAVSASQIYTIPPTVNGPALPIQIDLTKPPPSLPMGIPQVVPPGYPAGAPIIPHPAALQPPGTEFIQLPPTSGGAYLQAPGTFIPVNQAQVAYNPEEKEENSNQHDNMRNDDDHRYRDYRGGSRRDYDRDRDRYPRRSEDHYSGRPEERYAPRSEERHSRRDDYKESRERDRDRDRVRERDRDRDRERDTKIRDKDREKRRREDSPRHKSSRRKHDEEERYSSTKHKKSKKHKHKDRDDGEMLLTEDQIKREPVEST